MTLGRSIKRGLPVILVSCVLMLVFTASAQTGLQLVPPENVPLNGTFYLLSQEESESPVPPSPIDPYSGAQPVFLLDPEYGIYLIADTPESYAALLEAATQGGMFTMEEDPPPPPGEGGTNEWTFEYTPLTFSSNDLHFSVSVTNDTAYVVIFPPWNVSDGVYDLFCSTCLGPGWWDRVCETDAGQTNLTLTNLAFPTEFFILGLTNDTDAGGLSDAFEGLLGLDFNDANDDHLPPIVGISTNDPVAVEQQPTNTASFHISRLGGHMRWPLTVAIELSGTATNGVNYSLTPVTVTSSNVLVTIPAYQTNVVLTLTAIDNQVPDGTKSATLTLGTNSGWQVDSTNYSATAWIIEQHTKVYTTVADFNEGVLAGLESVAPAPDGQLQFKTNLPPQFPFINVACSQRGTVARINTTNGVVIGEYRTAPWRTNTLVGYADPSRTTVDQYGNVWVANRHDTEPINGTDYGSITRIGLILGPRYSRTNGVYQSDPNGQYVGLTNATYNTCMDRDGDGYIRTSTGLADILPWSNVRGGVYGVDTEGGVSTAEDEAITEYVRVPCTGTRTVAVDKFNDIWVGGHEGERIHLKINGLTGQPVPNSAFAANAGGYGGVIDGLGNLWSSGTADENAFLLQPPTNFPVQATDWQVLSVPSIRGGYGIAVDPLHPYIWQTYANNVFRWHTNGTPVTDEDGNVEFYQHNPGTSSASQGLTVDTNGHVWVAQSIGATTIGHLETNGVWLGNVQVGAHPTGVSVDSFGKIWAANLESNTAVRIDPNAGQMIVTNGITNYVGAADMYVDLGDGSENGPHQPPYDVPAKPYNYSDMTGFNNRVVNPGLRPFKGYWKVMHDCGVGGEIWDHVSWTDFLTNGCSIEVYVRASDDRQVLGNETFVPVTNNAALDDIQGQFIEVRLAITRDDADKQPVLYDLTLYGTSSGY